MGFGEIQPLVFVLAGQPDRRMQNGRLMKGGDQASEPEPGKRAAGVRFPYVRVVFDGHGRRSASFGDVPDFLVRLIRGPPYEFFRRKFGVGPAVAGESLGMISGRRPELFLVLSGLDLVHRGVEVVPDDFGPVGDIRHVHFRRPWPHPTVAGRQPTNERLLGGRGREERAPWACPRTVSSRDNGGGGRGRGNQVDAVVRSLVRLLSWIACSMKAVAAFGRLAGGGMPNCQTRRRSPGPFAEIDIGAGRAWSLRYSLRDLGAPPVAVP